MNKNKFLFAVLFSLALVFGMIVTGCQTEEAWVPEEKGPLTGLTIGGGSANLGKPGSDMATAAAGAGFATIYSETRNDDGEPVVKIPEITPSAGADSVEVKYAVTADNLTFPDLDDFETGAPAELKNGDYLWIQVTVEGKDPVYFVIELVIKYGSSNYDPFKSQPVSRSLTLAQWNAASAAFKTLTVEMKEESADYKYQWFSNTFFSNKGGSPINGATSAGYTPDISEPGTYYYYATITLFKEFFTSLPVMIRINDSVSEAATEFTIGTDRRNYVRGIGGTGSFMFRTGSNADASPDADVKYIDLLMGELGCNILRIMVQDDYERYITNAIQSRNQAQFYHNARDNFFPVIRKVNEYGGYVFANPWTAPASMKTGGTEGGLAGGRLTENGPNYVDYAEHLRSFLKWLNTNNAPIFALGILNEPDFGGGANYEGMGMSNEVTRDWFKTVGNFTTEKVTNKSGAGVTTSNFEPDIIPGYGGGKATHHVLAMSGDSMGNIANYMDLQLDDSVSNNKIELMGRHYYSNADRYSKAVGAATGAWSNRPQLSYAGPYESEALAVSPQMYAPGSTAGNIKREIWQTEHDFNYHNNSTTPPASNVQNYWNSAFAALNDIDWCLRVNGESVFCWWYSSSFSGFVTSYQTAGFPPYTITPRGRAIAHYARYVNETWFLPIQRTRGTINFNAQGDTVAGFNAGSTDPKISAFEDVNGKFISVVMYTPSRSTSGGNISNSFGAGGTTNPSNNPTSGSNRVGRVSIVLPEGFAATGVSALRSYGNDLAADEDWDNVPRGTPRYWIDDPVFLSEDGKSFEVTLPGGNIISVMVKGEWKPEYLAANPRHFEERKRPYTVK
jgi:hypothetical protein